MLSVTTVSVGSSAAARIPDANPLTPTVQASNALRYTAFAAMRFSEDGPVSTSSNPVSRPSRKPSVAVTSSDRSMRESRVMTTLKESAPIERSDAVSCIESRYCSSARVSSPALVTTTATTAAAVTTAGQRNRPRDRLRGLGGSRIMVNGYSATGRGEKRMPTQGDTGGVAPLAIAVGEGGLEPPRSCDHRNLNPARLPIPPLARDRGEIVPLHPGFR